MYREFLGIGVDSYDAPRYGNLSGAIRDAAKMGAFFQYGLPEGFRFDKTELLPNPTSDAATAYLEDALARMTDDSIFVFYFAGHGLSLRQGKQYLLCREASSCLADGVVGVGALSLDYMRSIARRGKGNIFFCYDVCRSEVEVGCRGTTAAMGASGFRDATTERPDASVGGSGLRWSLLSCGDGQVASDDGAFVDALLEAMRATLAQGRGLRLSDDLVAETMKRLGDARRRPESSGNAFYLVPDVKKSSETKATARESNAPTIPPLATRQPGKRAILSIVGLRIPFRWAPAGRFVMGSPETEVGRNADETRHEAILTKGFWLAETPTTQALWKAVMANNPSCFQDDDLLPVENVSWSDCQEFIMKLNRLAVPSVDFFRLPTETEWEYACRAGATSAYYWGAVPHAGAANCAFKDANGRITSLRRTTKVGAYPPNPWGLLDMVGNAWEWTADWYGAYDARAKIDPLGASSGAFRVVRGGSWNYGESMRRSANRFARVPEGRYNDGGFRLVMVERE